MRLKWVLIGFLVPLTIAGGIWYKRETPKPAGTLSSGVTVGTHKLAWENIVEGAKQQARDGAAYDASYVRIAYPNGDLPIAQGACTDVVIRALRHAGYDLQQLIHEDMRARFSEYPRRGLTTDSNIDHRRIPNQIAYFKKYGQSLTKQVNRNTLAEWQPGDIVYWNAYGRDHTGVVSDSVDPDGKPMVVHNIAGCTEEPCLTRWPIVGHYRFPRDLRD
ncbi:MAG: uncharacterized protein QOJ65_335 [Fimbriimonadaceae bacterium]|jgi:uncharacterized protein YijF (DUF1287 family)|nr:uncharacterized protein [Fimbriimonadaceae bacterium]